MTRDIRNSRSELIGQTVDRGDKVEIFDARRNLRGTWNKKTDETRDARGTFVGRGQEHLAMLLCS